MTPEQESYAGDDVTQTLTIPGRFPSLNEVIEAAKSHYGAYSKMKRELTLSVAVLAKAGRLKAVHGLVKVVFFWYEQDARRDVDNVCAAGTKFCLDGLVEAGILADDGQKTVSQLVHHFSVSKDKPRVVIEITELT
jgi:Holliday junction resolvase RusA-like endonuclease